MDCHLLDHIIKKNRRFEKILGEQYKNFLGLTNNKKIFIQKADNDNTVILLIDYLPILC